MFTELFTIMGKATLSLTIQRTGTNELTVGITPKTEGSDLVPAVLTGSPEELDQKFAETINGLVQDSESHFLKNSAQKQSMKAPEGTAKSKSNPTPAASPKKETAPKAVEKQPETLDLF